MTDYRQKSATAARLWALIPCAGTGARCGSAVPKQYQALAGRPMVLHTLAAFASVARIANMAIVVAPGDAFFDTCLLYTSPSPRDGLLSRMPSSA